MTETRQKSNEAKLWDTREKLDYREICNIKDHSNSEGKFAVKLLDKFFSYDELSDPQVNLSGKKSNGSTNETRPLDPKRINEIKRIVLDFVQGGDTVKKVVWRTCEVAINKQLSRLRKNKINTTKK